MALKCYWCPKPAKKGMASLALQKLHSVCYACGEKEYQQCLEISGFKRSSVLQAQKQYNKEGGGVTYTIRKMSGKGIRTLARYLAILKLGGGLEDTPETFYDRYSSSTGLSRRDCEVAFVNCTDMYEEKLREEDGFISSARAQEVAGAVAKKLGPGMWIEGDVEAEKPRMRVEKPPTKRVVSSGNIADLVKQLKSSTDPEVKRKLRRQLRKLGHKGGAS
jgi:hypothetical protein